VKTRRRAAAPDGYKAFEYNGEGRAVRIAPDQTVYGGVSVTDRLTVPFIWIVRLEFGRLDENKRLIPDETKRDECVRQNGVTTHGKTIRVRREPTPSPSGRPRDRVDFFSGEGGARLGTSLVCDHDDYARVFRFEVYDENGTLRVLREVDDYDAEGMPRSVRMVTSGGAGLVRMNVPLPSWQWTQTRFSLMTFLSSARRRAMRSLMCVSRPDG